jgi:iron only hydrogenase large subunit-like protein
LKLPNDFLINRTLTEKSDIQNVINALNSEGKLLIAQTAPSIRATLGECFGMPAGKNVTGKMVAALLRIGFHKVFDTDFKSERSHELCY